VKDIKEGLHARRKLDGNPEIIASDDPEILKAIMA